MLVLDAPNPARLVIFHVHRTFGQVYSCDFEKQLTEFI